MKRIACNLLVILFLAGCASANPSLGTTGSHNSGDSLKRTSPKKVSSLASPVRIAFTEGNNLLVSDYKRKALYILGKSDLGATGSYELAGRPLAVGSSGNLLIVGNETLGTLDVYNRSGRWLYHMGGEDVFLTATDLAVDVANSRVFVTDGVTKTVLVFDLRGPLLYSFPTISFVNPTGIALDAVRGEVLVSDYGDPSQGIAASIKIFGPGGNLLDTISGEGAQIDYRFSRPQGLAADGGRIFLVDGVVGRVLVFDRTTKLGVKRLGSFGAGPGELFLPLDVVVDSETKDVFVTNNRAGKVEVFRGGGTLP